MKRLEKKEMKQVTGGKVYYCLIYDVTGANPAQQFACLGCDGVTLYHPNDRCRQLVNPVANVATA